MLKYLFTAVYKDGTTYVQTPDDRSVIEPDKRSCFFDVKQDDVETFTLTGDGHSYLVDLRDGHFEIDGVPFQMHEEHLSDFRLVFFRRHTHQYQQSTLSELSHEMVYRMGWQCTVDGENYQEIMQIA